MREGFLASSAMFTESSKPTIAKKASVVAAITGQNRPCSPALLKSNARPKSPCPPMSAAAPIMMMISRPVSSMQVSTTFAFTLSPTPRRLISPSSTIKPMLMAVIRKAPSPRPKLFPKFSAKACEAVEAEVIPLDITAKATRKVRKCMPKAFCV